MIKNIKNLFFKDKLLKNIYRKSFSSKVLISYTLTPFFGGKKSHTNFQESLIIADLFDQLEYKVDVVNYTNTKDLDYQGYSVIFGFGEPFENSFHDSRCKAKRIYYATGAHVFHQNSAEARRVDECNVKYGVRLLPQRIVPWCWTLSTTFSDYLIVIGNNWTANTYKKFTGKPILSINATALINKDSDNIRRDIPNTRKNFLWFGSLGHIHKGLDLCLEYFSEHSEYTLHICGPKDPAFFKVFQDAFQETNIIYHGFINVASPEFIDIVSRCSFAILPSCSEGQSTALLTAMAAGLIPVATQETGIDLDHIGFRIEGLNLKSIDKSIQEISVLNPDAIGTLSLKCREYASCAHNVDIFREDMRRCLRYILAKT